MSEIKAPFTPDQVNSLNEFQKSGVMHPFTGNNDMLPDDEQDILVAAEDGWHSLNDPNYFQDWAHDWMADWSWKELEDWKNWKKSLSITIKDNNLCPTCRIPEHDQCSITVGCPCCADTIRQDR
jgi:hypothetical protein